MLLEDCLVYVWYLSDAWEVWVVSREFYLTSGLRAEHDGSSILLMTIVKKQNQHMKITDEQTTRTLS
eukprot:4952193-Amphidinium_carterae.1